MNIIKLDSVNSTNTYCNYLLTNPAGLPEAIRPADLSLPVCVIAREQYAGRGRYGKSFHSPANTGIYLSYAYEGKYSMEALLKLTVAVSAIVHQVLQPYCEDDLDIKWINDIYRNSRKIAGILCERVDDPHSDKYYIIIGIGINILPSAVPEELSNIVGFLSDNGDADLISQITNDLISALSRLAGEYRAAEFDALVEYYKDYCVNLPADFGNELLNQ